jgi:hypothetical protein
MIVSRYWLTKKPIRALAAKHAQSERTAAARRPQVNYCFSALGNGLAKLRIRHCYPCNAPGAVYRVHDVDPDVILGLLAAGHLMDDVGCFLDVAELYLARGEDK